MESKLNCLVAFAT